MVVAAGGYLDETVTTRPPRIVMVVGASGADKSSLLAAGLIGLAAALLRLSASPVGRVLSRVYLELVRNTPLLVQLFCLYFVLAPILGLGRMCTAILALGLFEGAYVSEIIRAGILSIDRDAVDRKSVV